MHKLVECLSLSITSTLFLIFWYESLFSPLFHSFFHLKTFYLLLFGQTYRTELPFPFLSYFFFLCPLSSCTFSPSFSLRETALWENYDFERLSTLNSPPDHAWPSSGESGIIFSYQKEIINRIEAPESEQNFIHTSYRLKAKVESY